MLSWRHGDVEFKLQYGWYGTLSTGTAGVTYISSWAEIYHLHTDPRSPKIQSLVTLPHWLTEWLQWVFENYSLINWRGRFRLMRLSLLHQENTTKAGWNWAANSLWWHLRVPALDNVMFWGIGTVGSPTESPCGCSDTGPGWFNHGSLNKVLVLPWFRNSHRRVEWLQLFAGWGFSARCGSPQIVTIIFGKFYLLSFHGEHFRWPRDGVSHEWSGKGMETAESALAPKKKFPCIDLILRYRHGYINIICSEVECDRTEL